MVFRWPIEIDGLPFLKMVDLCHNQMVIWVNHRLIMVNDLRIPSVRNSVKLYKSLAAMVLMNHEYGWFTHWGFHGNASLPEGFRGSGTWRWVSFQKTVGNHVQFAMSYPSYIPVIYVLYRMDCYLLSPHILLFSISSLYLKQKEDTDGYDGYITNSWGCLNHCFLEVFLNHQLISSHMQWRPARCRLEYPVAATTAWAPWWQVFGKLNKKQQVQK